MNWGTKIVLGMIAFMLFIIGMVVYMFSVHDNDALVEEDYYEKGINYDEEYTAKKNTLDDNAVPIIQVRPNEISIQLTEAAEYELLMMRPSSAKKDVTSKGKTIGRENLILVETTHLDRGLWSINLSWKVNGKAYKYKKDVTL